MSFFKLPKSKPVYKVEVDARKVVGPHLVAHATMYFLSPPTGDAVCKAIMDEFRASAKGHDIFPWSKAERAAHLRGAQECIKVVRRIGIPELRSERVSSIHSYDDEFKRRRGAGSIKKVPRLSVTRIWAQ